MRAQVEVELRGVGDADVHGGAGRDVAALAALLLLVRAEEARVVALLHHDEGDPWFVVWLQLQAIMMTIPSSGSLIVIVTHLDAGLPDGGELVLQDVCELALADAVPVHDDPVRLVAARALVEHHEVLPHHGGQVLDDVLPLLLHSHGRRVPADSQHDMSP